MLKDVLINIKGAQGSDGEESVIELTTDGRFGEKNGGSISMKYTIDQNLNFVSRNTVSITVREVKE